MKLRSVSRQGWWSRGQYHVRSDGAEVNMVSGVVERTVKSVPIFKASYWGIQPLSNLRKEGGWLNPQKRIPIQLARPAAPIFHLCTALSGPGWKQLRISGAAMTCLTSSSLNSTNSIQHHDLRTHPTIFIPPIRCTMFFLPRILYLNVLPSWINIFQFQFQFNFTSMLVAHRFHAHQLCIHLECIKRCCEQKPH